MEVKLNNEFGVIGRTVPSPSKARVTVSGGEDNVFFGQSQALNQNLTALPALRVEKVEKAQRLLLTDHYPPAEIQQKIARLLAFNKLKA
jgi:hypothetical protein